MILTLLVLDLVFLSHVVHLSKFFAFLSAYFGFGVFTLVIPRILFSWRVLWLL